MKSNDFLVTNKRPILYTKPWVPFNKEEGDLAGWSPETNFWFVINLKEIDGKEGKVRPYSILIQTLSKKNAEQYLKRRGLFETPASKFAGKIVGGKNWLHKSCFESMEHINDRVVKIIHNAVGESEFAKLIKNIDCDVIRVDKIEQTVAFIKVDNFDLWLNPKVLKSTLYFMGHKFSSKDYSDRKNLNIYHHKHLMVLPNYEGFSIGESKEWSEACRESGIEELNDLGRMGYSESWKKGLIKLNIEKYGKYLDKSKNITEV